MKSILIVLVLLAICAFSFSSCKNGTNDTESTLGSTTPETQAHFSTQSVSTQTELSSSSVETSSVRPADTYTRATSIKVFENQESLDHWDYAISYRYIYYKIDSAFSSLVPWDDQNAWFENYMKESAAKGGEPSEMMLVSFVKAFNIPRETFDEAVKNLIDGWALHDYVDMDERYEIPNADIIYTFDNEIINDYYRRER